MSLYEEGPFDTSTATNLHHDPRGSIWRRWDLHVHTPKSLIQHYPGGDTAAGWDDFLTDLEHLPADIKAIGINDYLFIDGYEAVIAAKQAGRLANIELILPVIELRLDKFGGTDSHLSRINYHIIFSNEISPTEIREQFLNLLTADYTVGKPFNKAINRTTLAELGQQLIDATPAAKRTNETPLTVGYNNLNFHLAKIEQLLENTTFTNKFLTAVGKTEWADVKWQQSAADKRTIIDRADFVFIAAQTPDHCRKAHDALRDEGVNHRLLDCSDAHYPSNSTHKDRLGNCHTWLKADTTFDGLRQVRQAPAERIFLADTPPKLLLIRQQPTKFITDIEIRRKPNASIIEQWFDNHIAINPDLIAIIGNKGMGKSALTDIIALTSNAEADADTYGFLTENKFRDRKNNKARHFTATITWASGDTLTRGLDENVPTGTVPMVRYIPQNYFEALCNETTNAARLQRELRSVIFSNLAPAQRGKFADLDTLIKTHTNEAARHIDELRAELHTVNREIVQLERDLSTTKRKELEDALQQAEAALAAHDQNQPASVSAPPQQASTPDLDTARKERDDLDQRIAAERRHLQDLYETRTRTANLITRFRTLQEAIAKLRTSITTDLQQLELSFEQLLPATVNLQPLDERTVATEQQITTLEALLDGTNGLVTKHAAVLSRIAELQDALDAPARAYQQYLDQQKQWEQRRTRIIGTTDSPGSIEYLKARLTTVRHAQAERLAALESERLTLARAIHEQLCSITTFQATLYAPAAERLANHAVVRAQLNVNFTSKLVDTGLAPEFMKRINRNRVGKFSDEHAMRDHITPLDLNNTDDVEQLLRSTVELLHEDQHGESGDIDDVQRQLRKGYDNPEDLYNFLFGLEYLDPQFALRINDRELAQLTPGERGSLLLVFYLVIDQDDRPLIIDQPEENLDNQSVFELLAPCITEAKCRRQIIMVTHNPNLAVVCNAEQVIWSRIAKDADHAVTYEPGSIENPAINKHLVDVLEGTWPAFTDRGHKYHEWP